MNNIKNYGIPLLALSVYPLLAYLYEYLNARTVKTVNLTTVFDQIIPFKPLFILPYYLWFPFSFISLLYFLFKNQQTYYRVILTDTLGRFICFIIYFLYPTTVPRPTIEGNTFLLSLVKWLYENDYPTNCFPSIHCLNTFIIMLALYTSSFQTSRSKLFIYGIGWMIIFSTLFVKQHVILDILASLVIVFPLYLLVTKLLESKINNPSTAIKRKRAY